MTDNKSDETGISDSGELADEMWSAMAGARKALRDLPPLEGLAGLLPALANLLVSLSTHGFFPILRVRKRYPKEHT